MKIINLSLLAIVFMIATGVSYAENCPVGETCRYTIYGHSGRTISFSGIEQEKVYRCQFNTDRTNAVDIRSPYSASPGLSVTYDTSDTHLPITVIANASKMGPTTGFFEMTFYNAEVGSARTVQVGCYIA